MKKVTDAQDLGQLLSLKHIAEWSMGGDLDREQVVNATEEADFQFEMKLEIGDNFLRTFLRASMANEALRVHTELVAFWSSDEDLDIEAGALAEFARTRSVQALYPYARASLSLSASRFDVALPVLPVLREDDVPPFDPSDFLGGRQSLVLRAPVPSPAPPPRSTLAG